MLAFYWWPGVSCCALAVVLYYLSNWNVGAAFAAKSRYEVNRTGGTICSLARLATLSACCIAGSSETYG